MGHEVANPVALSTRAQFRVLGILRTSVSISDPYQDVSRAIQVQQVEQVLVNLWSRSHRQHGVFKYPLVYT